MMLKTELPTLVKEARAGDLEAFGVLVDHFQRMAYIVAYSMVSDAQFAEDVAQEAFVEAYLNLPNLREPAAFPGWFRRIIFKQGDRHLRGKHLQTVSLEATPGLDFPITRLDPARIVAQQELQEAVLREVQLLPPDERLLVQLFYTSGYAQKEIAEFLELPLSTIKKRLFTARQHLKHRLHQVFVEELLEPKEELRDSYFARKVQLIIVIRQGKLDWAKELIKRDVLLVNSKLDGASRNLGTSNRIMLPIGYTPLHAAAAYARYEMIDLLLEYGANINARTSHGTTPLHLAINSRQPGAVALLLVHGANKEIKTVVGLTPLHWASIGDNGVGARLLLEHGACSNALDQFGRSPLHWSALKGFAELTELLLSYGANPSLEDQTGQRPLDWARSRGYIALAERLEAEQSRKEVYIK